MATRPKLIVKGDKALIKKLKRLGDKRKIKKVVRRATNAAAQVVVKAVRAKWPRDTGLSARSVTKKIVKTSSGFSAVIGVDKAAIGEGEHIPSNIDHLIELGYQTADGKTVPAVAPLRTGSDAAMPEAMRIFEEKARQEIEKEARKK